MAIPKKLRQKNNEAAASYFAAGVAGIIILFIALHLYRRYISAKTSSPVALRFPIVVTRIIRSLLLRKVPGFVSAGHNLVFLGYVVINLCITFTRIDWTNLVSLSKRLGWTTIANLALVIFLSLKNTPLGFLTSYSYERLQPLHQVAGYTTIACWFMHTVVYLTAWDYSHNLHEMLELDNVMGIVAGIAMLVILASTLLRSRSYELFYILHITFALLVLITAGLHRPQLAKKSSYAVIFAGTIWGFDRLVRILRVSLHGIGNTATLYPLSHGGTKIMLKKHVIGARPGMHIFLYLPAVRKFELHPFTIVAVKPLELVVAARDGFTKDLHAHAVQNPGAEIRASVDGAYGSVPDFRGLSKVLFIAGGSGGSYTAGVAADLLRGLDNESKVAIEFVWVMRHTDILPWYESNLAELSSSPRVNMRIHVTHHSTGASTSPSLSDLSTEPNSRPLSAIDPEKSVPISANEVVSDTQVVRDVEKNSFSSPSSPSEALPTFDGRPDIPTLVNDLVAGASKNERLAVLACGPTGMMLQVRRAVADNLKGDGPSLELYSEAFGW